MTRAPSVVEVRWFQFLRCSPWNLRLVRNRFDLKQNRSRGKIENGVWCGPPSIGWGRINEFWRVGTTGGSGGRFCSFLPDTGCESGVTTSKIWRNVWIVTRYLQWRVSEGAERKVDGHFIKYYSRRNYSCQTTRRVVLTIRLLDTPYPFSRNLGSLMVYKDSNTLTIWEPSFPHGNKWVVLGRVPDRFTSVWELTSLGEPKFSFMKTNFQTSYYRRYERNKGDLTRVLMVPLCV